MDRRTPLWLTLISTVPFVIMSLSIAFRWVSDIQSMVSVFIIYAAIIFAFLAGIHWGLAVSHIREFPRIAYRMLAESTIAAVLTWLIMFLSPVYQLLAFALLYALIWGVDSILFNNKIIPLWFFNLRGIVTPIVVVSMYVTYFSIT